MDVDVRRDRFVHKGPKTQPKVRGVLHHTKRQSHTHCLQLRHSEHADGHSMGEEGKVRKKEVD